MEQVIVTRHPALVKLIGERKLADPQKTPVVAHATADDVAGKHVIGILPLSLAAEAAMVTEIPLALTPNDRGQELPLERLREIAGDARTYQVRAVKAHRRTREADLNWAATLEAKAAGVMIDRQPDTVRQYPATDWGKVGSIFEGSRGAALREWAIKTATRIAGEPENFRAAAQVIADAPDWEVGECQELTQLRAAIARCQTTGTEIVPGNWVAYVPQGCGVEPPSCGFGSGYWDRDG